MTMDIDTSPGEEEQVSYEATMPYGDRAMASTAHSRSAVLPPSHLLFLKGDPLMEIDHGDAPTYPNDHYGNSAFMYHVAQTRPTQLPHNMLSWKFQDRYQAHMIVPFLYLGPSKAAKDPSFVDEKNITYLMAVRNSAAVSIQPKYLDPASLPTSTGRQTATLDINGPFDFIRNIRPAIKAVVDHLEASCANTTINSEADIPARILVYCESGSDRSSVFVAAFLMVFYGLSAAAAVQLMQSQRFCVTVDEGMKNMLQDFEDILKAERQVFVHGLQVQQSRSNRQQNSTQMSSLKAATKRSMARVQEEDEDMIGEEWSRAQQRGGIAPFRDIANGNTR